MSRMSDLHIDIMNGDAEALQIALAIAHESAQPKTIYLLMDGQTVIHAYADEQLALMEAHIMMQADTINAGLTDSPPEMDVWVKPMSIDYTPFDWLDGFEREQATLGASSPDAYSNAQLDLFYDTTK